MFNFKAEMDRFPHERATEKKSAESTFNVEPNNDKMFEEASFADDSMLVFADPDINLEVEEVDETIDVENLEAEENTEAREKESSTKNSKSVKGFNGKPEDREEKIDNASRLADANNAEALPLNEKILNNQETEKTTNKKKIENKKKKDSQVDKMFTSDKDKITKDHADKEIDKISDSTSSKNNKSSSNDNKKKHERRSTSPIKKNKPPVCNYKSKKNENSQVAKMIDAVEKNFKDSNASGASLPENKNQSHDKHHKTEKSKINSEKSKNKNVSGKGKKHIAITYSIIKNCFSFYK